MTQLDGIETVILAGGHSVRMGMDKACLLVEGQPMLQRICQAAIACTGKVSVITPWPERYQSIVPPACQLIQETGVFLTLPAPGPLLGFAQATIHVTADWILLLACDLAQLQSESINGWMNQLATVSPQTWALLPRHSKGWEPLCGFYHRRCFPSLQPFIVQGGRSFQGWLATLPVAELTVSDRQCLFNCNTPQDLAQLRNHGY